MPASSCRPTRTSGRRTWRPRRWPCGEDSGDGSRIAIGETNGTVTLLDAESLSVVGTPVRLGTTASWLSASPDNRSAFVTTGGRYLTDDLEIPQQGWVIVDLQAGRVVRTGDLPVTEPSGLAYSPDGRRVALAGGSGEMAFLDSRTGRPIRPPVTVHQELAWYLAFSADASRFVTSGSDGSVSLFDGRTADRLGSIVVPSRTLSAAEFLADGHTVLVASFDQAVYLWDTRAQTAIEFGCRMAGRELTSTEWRENFGDRPFRPTCPGQPGGAT